MVIIEEPFVSEQLTAWLEETQHPVLDNPTARRIAADGHALAIIDEADAIARLNANERVFTNGENALEWVLANLTDDANRHAIRTYKDKAAMRRALASLDPDVFFKTLTLAELKETDFASLPAPFIIKPTVGFCSMGVYRVSNGGDWRHALASIEADHEQWTKLFPDCVIQDDSFIVESVIEGDEYGIEGYYDETGKAHVINVMRHEFASEHDMSDRLYMTAPSLVRSLAPLFESWLDEVNQLIGAHNIPIHPEVRVSDGRVHAIEFNPLRFMGLGGTDMARFAYGLRTWAAFLDDESPDFDRIFKDKEDRSYAMLIANPSAALPITARFDYERFEAQLPTILEARRMDAAQTGLFGFYFLDITDAPKSQIGALLASDLGEFRLS